MLRLMEDLLCQRPILVLLQVLEKECLGEAINKSLRKGTLVGGGCEVDTSAKLRRRSTTVMMKSSLKRTAAVKMRGRMRCLFLSNEKLWLSISEGARPFLYALDGAWQRFLTIVLRLPGSATGGMQVSKRTFAEL